MNSLILHKDAQNFIAENLNAELSKVIFKGSPIQGISIKELAEQIESKQRSQDKLPSWFACEGIYYPNKLSIEQTSSEVSANYKAALIAGQELLDLTGGFGVDALAFSKVFKKVIHCELDKKLAKIAKHNFKVLGASNVTPMAVDGLDHLKKAGKPYDWIYADPSRRHEHKGKVFMLKDCQPNIPEELRQIFDHSSKLLLKVSPILDILSAVKELGQVKEVHVIAVQNEVKELLFMLEKGYDAATQIRSVNITKGRIDKFDSILGTRHEASYSQPKKFLFEPNAAILKAGLFNEVSNKLNVHKLHVNSHLYTSDKNLKFPGRAFIIKEKLPFNKKLLKRLLPENKANISRRNFPESVAAIRKKTGIRDGGSKTLFFTTDVHNKHIVLICEKINAPEPEKI